MADKSGSTYSSLDFNNINSDRPRKQAKSYEIDLGQNEGAYKEELLIRYGDNTLNQIMSKKNRGNNMNVEDIIKMNEELQPFQERKRNSEEGESYTKKCEKIENRFGRIDDDSDNLKNSEKDLNDAFEKMTSDIFTFFDKTYNEFNPELYGKYKLLKQNIKNQKDENANLLKQIDLLLQENTQIMDMVYKVGSRLEILEKKVGIKTNLEDDGNADKNYDEENNNSNTYKEDENNEDNVGESNEQENSGNNNYSANDQNNSNEKEESFNKSSKSKSGFKESKGNDEQEEVDVEEGEGEGEGEGGDEEEGNANESRAI